MVNKTTSKKAANKKSATLNSAEAIERGIQLVESGDRQAAFDLFQQTVELDPNAAEAWVWLGGTSNSLAAAELAFERAYSLDPQNEEASLGLRWVQLQRTPPVTYGATEAALVTEQPSTPGSEADMAPAPAQRTLVCPNCGTENAEDDRFCVRCGQNLTFGVDLQTTPAAVVADDSVAANGYAAAMAPADAVAPAPAKRGLDRRVVVGVLVALIFMLTALIVWYIVWGSR